MKALAVLIEAGANLELPSKMFACRPLHYGTCPPPHLRPQPQTPSLLQQTRPFLGSPARIAPFAREAVHTAMFSVL